MQNQEQPQEGMNDDEIIAALIDKEERGMLFLISLLTTPAMLEQVHSGDKHISEAYAAITGVTNAEGMTVFERCKSKGLLTVHG